MVRMNKTRKQIVNKLVQLELVDDRKTLRKPRQTKKGRSCEGIEGEPVHVGGHSSDSSGTLNIAVYFAGNVVVVH